MLIFDKISDISLFLAQKKAEGISIGFVPTMGALHEGHLSLISNSKEENDITVCSIFVNPTQFNDKKDLENYPRTIDSDEAKLKSVNCDVLFVPEVKEVYPEGAETFRMDFGNLDKVMEGKFRAGHFNGVAMVVDKLFRIINPSKAYFGEKDFQQLAIVTELAKRNHPTIQIVPCSTVRESDGLAMSSRNILLNKDERIAAALLSEILFEAKKKSNNSSADELKNWAIKRISENKLFQLEYFEIVDSTTLQNITNRSDTKKIRACVAVKIGKVRLIDNVEL